MKKILVSCLLAIGLLLTIAVPSMAELSPWMQSVADKADPELVDMDKTLDITWWGWNDNGILPKDNTPMQQIIEKRFNIKVTNVPIDCYNTEQVNLYMSTAEDFDICTVRPANFAKMAEMELIREVDPEMIRTYAPTITAILEEELGENWTDYCKYDGKFWGIPQITASWKCPNVMGINTAYLNAIGYDETNLPTTMEELEAMLLKLHTDDPDGNGKEDTYALGKSNDYGYYELAYYGIAKNYWYYDEDGTLMTAAADPALKDALKLMQRWYALGIYDPEITTDGRSEGVAKYANGIIAGYESLDNCLQSIGGATLSGPGAAFAKGENMPVTIIPPVEGSATVMYSVPVSTSGVVFGYNCSDEKMIRLLQIQDTYFRDLDLWFADSYGEKGVNWDLDEEGNVHEYPEEGYVEREAQSDSGEQHFFNFSFMPESVLAWRQGGVGVEGSRYEIFMQVKDFPVIEPSSVSVFTTDADIEYGDACNKVYSEYFMKAVMGEVDIDETFDAYQQQWLQAGGQEILDAKRAMDAE